MIDSLWKVAVEAPLPEALTYSSSEPLQRGQRVIVPLGKRKVTGVVIGQTPPVESEYKVKSILEVDASYPPLGDAMMKLGEWLANYYLHPIGMVFSQFYPPLSPQVKARKSKNGPVVKLETQTWAPELTAEQKSCLDAIKDMDKFSTHLVFGVTGSGKTEIYLNLLERVLANGKKGLVLVPEISLTPQLVQRFAARFGDQVAVLHSQLTDRERTNQWWDVIENRKNILIGARSAIFCPASDVGLIIVDEEHESSFKQDEKLKYHGRDTAVYLGKLLNCPVVLGSATPSLETWKNATEGKYQLHTLKNRVNDRALPTVTVIPLKQEDPDKRESLDIDRPFWMSEELFEAMHKTLDEKNQVALFLNRRGMAQMVLCPDCGHVAKCPNCEISLTLHSRSHLICHYCDYHENLKQDCPECKEGEMKAIGLGTEQVENDLHRLFPNHVVARADRDEIQTRQDMEELIEKMEKNEIHILIGTQMIAKGLDFPHLKLVGLLLADIGFNLPDFRSTERSFQLITQMSGRSGRHVKEGEEPGQVIIQAYNTNHDSLQFAINHDFVGFANFELQNRSALLYPPFGRIISLRVQGPDQELARKTSEQLARRAEALKGQYENYQQVEILGPATAPIAKLRNNFRFHLLLKSTSSNALNQFVRHLFKTEDWVPNKIKIAIDVDPLSLL